MKLLIYGLNYAPEPVGIGKYSGELAEWLAARGHQVRVISAPPYFPEWQAKGNRYHREQRRGVSIWRCPLWVPKYPSGLSRLLHLASFAISSFPVLIAQGIWKPDVVITIAPAFFCAPGALLLGKICGKGTTSWLHIQDFELDAAFALGILKGRLMRGLAESWESKTLRGFDTVSTISEAMRQRTMAKGVRPEATYLLPNWVDLDAIQAKGAQLGEPNAYRNELGIPDKAIVLLYSGSMNKKQGLELLVEVIRELKMVSDLIWILAGEGPTKAELVVSTAGMANVQLLPLQPAERMSDWLSLADIHLLPQKGGAADLVLPSKLLGILASGRPFVASSPEGSELGKLAELAGVRVDPDDSRGFSKALCQLVSDGELRARLGFRGRLIAEKTYGKERILEQLEAEFQKYSAAGKANDTALGWKRW